MWTAFDNTEGRLGGRERHVVGHYRLGEPFEGERADFFERCRPFDRDGDTLSDEDLPVLGLSAKPRGEIAHGADRGVAGAFREADLAEGRITLRDTGAKAQFTAAATPFADHCAR